MDLLLRPQRLIQICGRLDSSGIIHRFVHIPDKGELYDFNAHINISEENPDINMYYVRFGYDLKIENIQYNINRYPMAILVTSDGVELNIMFTPNHFDDFYRLLKKQLKAVAKKRSCYMDCDNIPEEVYYLYDTLREYRFHSRFIRNYFWNNLLSFYFDKDKIIQQQ